MFSLACAFHVFAINGPSYRLKDKLSNEVDRTTTT
jgi:hypothetical protein